MPFKIHHAGLTVTIRLTPNAHRCSFNGRVEVADNKAALKVSVNAVPEDGKANKALIDFLAKSWKLPKSSLSLLSGSAHRLKVVLITGESDKLMAQLLKQSPDLFQ